jgi:hypothetical protein
VIGLDLMFFSERIKWESLVPSTAMFTDYFFPFKQSATSQQMPDVTMVKEKRNPHIK